MQNKMTLDLWCTLHAERSSQCPQEPGQGALNQAEGVEHLIGKPFGTLFSKSGFKVTENEPF